MPLFSFQPSSHSRELGRTSLKSHSSTSDSLSRPAKLPSQNIRLGVIDHPSRFPSQPNRVPAHRTRFPAQPSCLHRTSDSVSSITRVAFRAIRIAFRRIGLAFPRSRVAFTEHPTRRCRSRDSLSMSPESRSGTSESPCPRSRVTLTKHPSGCGCQVSRLGRHPSGLGTTGE